MKYKTAKSSSLPIILITPIYSFTFSNILIKHFIFPFFLFHYFSKMYCSNEIKYPVDFFSIVCFKNSYLFFFKLERWTKSSFTPNCLYLHYSPADKHINVSLTTHEGNKKKHSESKQYCFAHLWNGAC